MRKLDVNPYIKPRYKILEFIANLQIFFGAVIIVFSILASYFSYGLLDSYIEEFSVIIVLGILFLGILQGIMLIGFGQLILLFVDMSEDVYVQSRETLKFFKWYSADK